MKNWMLYTAWGVLYVLCVGLGKISDPQGFGRFLMILTSLLFFVPGALLLYRGKTQEDRKTVKTVRLTAIASLSLTLILLVANFLAVGAPEQTGLALNDILILVSAPMVCGQNWLVSLFLWACLLFASLGKKK